MTDWQVIEDELSALLEPLGFELVELQKVTGRGAHVTLLVDRLGAPGTITLDDCAEVSREAARYLDEADPIRGSYRLQVSSPGVDRPLNRPSHFERAVGQVVRVRHTAGEGPRTDQGRLTAVTEDGITMELEGGPLVLSWPTIAKANVVYDWGE